MGVGQATELLLSSRAGNAVAAAELFPLVYEQLRTIACQQLARERADHTLQPTALVNEAFLKLVDQTKATILDRNHFLAVAAEAMHRILIDHARKKRAAKRGGDWNALPLDTQIPLGEEPDLTFDLAELGDALERLNELDDRARRVVELRYFAGLTSQETAEILGVSRRTVNNDWTFARRWLFLQLSERKCQEDS